MREIKFRAWNKITNKIVDDISFNVVRGKPTNPSEITLMQYIGIKDRNGKEIYEGDIVECRCGMSNCIKTNPNPIKMEDAHFLNDATKLLEVTGNIYENGNF